MSPSPSVICPTIRSVWPYNPVGFFCFGSVLKLCFLWCCHSLSKAAVSIPRLQYGYCSLQGKGTHTMEHDRSYWTLGTWHWFGNLGTEDSLECYCHMDGLYHSVSSVQTSSHVFGCGFSRQQQPWFCFCFISLPVASL